ncbi:MAG: uroporphyrinogen decarboxylase family protein, partial [Pseudomonadota bacterium]
PYLKVISDKFQGRLGYYSKNTVAEHMDGLWSETKFSGYGYDHRWSLPGLFGQGQGFIQGNFDQTRLFLPEPEFETYLRGYLAPFHALSPEERAGWVCGLGHGVLPETPEKNVKNFVKIVREVFS